MAGGPLGGGVAMAVGGCSRVEIRTSLKGKEQMRREREVLRVTQVHFMPPGQLEGLWRPR